MAILLYQLFIQQYDDLTIQYINMNEKMDGVKIAVSNENANENTTANEPEKPAVKKRKSARRKTVKSAGEKKETGRNLRRPDVSGALPQLAIAVIITTVVAGGGIYLWQNSTVGKSLDKISAEAVSSKEDFEKRLENLKEKLSGTEKEKAELLAAKKDLEEKAELLAGAKKQYVSNDLGFSFLYPALFGEASIEFVQKATGTAFIGRFSLNNKLIFSGASKDYVREATSSIYAFGETQGFIDKQNKYYFHEPNKNEAGIFEIQPVKIIGYRGGEALLVDKKSFVGQDEFTKNSGNPFLDIGENAGALLNLKNDKYQGLAFINMDFSLLPLDDFAEMLKTLEVK